MVNRFNWLLSILLLQIGTLVLAETQPYLLQQIEQSKPSMQAVEKAKKQITDLKEIKLQEISLAAFHMRKKNPINDSAAYCTECHLPLPHQKRLRSRAFLNMHVDFVACETCHYRPENIELNYSWFDYQQHKVLVPQTSLWHSGRKKDDKMPFLSKDGNLKIVPLLNGEPVIATKHDPSAKALYQQWKDANTDEKAQLKAKLHLPLSLKGPECRACHISVTDAKLQTGVGQLRHPLLNLTELGANEQQRTAIEQNTIADFFAHYQSDSDDEKTASATTNINTEQGGEKEQRIRITQFLK